MASIYQVPLVFKGQILDEIILSHFGLISKPSDLKDWEKNVVERLFAPKKTVQVAVVGKYIGLQDAYKSIYEAITHAGISNQVKVEVRKIDSEDVEKLGPEKLLKGMDAVLVPGGFGGRGIEGKIKAIGFARKNKIPFLGLCLGMQCVVVDFARHVCGLKDANSTEFKPKTRHPVISLLSEQKNIKDLGGTMRLGSYPCKIMPNTLAAKVYRSHQISERHRHRYEFNNEYRKKLESKGLVFSGIYQEKNLVEIVELKGHPYFIAVQFHPEFKSKPDAAHPLFDHLIRAAAEKK